MRPSRHGNAGHGDCQSRRCVSAVERSRSRCTSPRHAAQAVSSLVHPAVQNFDRRNRSAWAVLAACPMMLASACIGLGGSSMSTASAFSAPKAVTRRSAISGRTLAHQHSRGPLPTHSFGRSCPVKLHIALRSPLRRAVSSLRRSTEKALAELATGRPRWSLKRRWFAARACCATSNSSCLTRQCPSAIQCAAHGTVVAQLLHHDARATRRHCRRDWRLGLAESRRCSPQQT